jgi:glycerol uptake facilitator-like aquaporin
MAKYVTTVNGMQSYKPTRKVMAAGLAGLIVTAIIWAVGQFTDFPLNPELIAALELVVMSIVAYFTPPGESEGSKQVG